MQIFVNITLESSAVIAYNLFKMRLVYLLKLQHGACERSQMLVGRWFCLGVLWWWALNRNVNDPCSSSSKSLDPMILAITQRTLLTMLIYLLAVFVEPLSNRVKLCDRFVRVVMFRIGRARLLANQLRHRSPVTSRE